MKKFISFLFLLILFGACKKNSEPAPVPLISRVTVDGAVAYKFFYNTSNQITKWEFYSYDAPGAPLAVVFDFTYDNNGKLSEIMIHRYPGNVPESRLFFEYNSLGKIIGHELYDLQGADPSKPWRWGVYQYSAAGRLSTVTMRDKDGKLDTRYNLSYYDDGALKQRDSYEETVTQQLRLTGRVIYSVPIVSGIKGWEPITVIPLDGDEITRTVRYDAIQRYEYNNGVLTFNTSELISAREYNSDGTLKRHVFTRKRILPASDDVVMNWEFEYIQQ